MSSTQIIKMDWFGWTQDQYRHWCWGVEMGLKEVRLQHYEQGVGKQNLRERCDLEDLGIDGRIVLYGSSGNRMGIWTRLIWLRIRTCGRLL
jgi:hypothetical protein